MTEKLNLEDLKRRMEGAISAFSHDLAGLRTGRASVNMIDQITVDAYGSKMPIEQVGTISVPEPRTISIQVWDKGLVVSVEKSIQESGLGLNPQTDGQLVRIPVPELNEERRQELIKIAGNTQSNLEYLLEILEEMEWILLNLWKKTLKLEKMRVFLSLQMFKI